ncbi:MAG TPA: cysteine desulfurase [bacterium]|nr:cysteine desulfurase [bacterium]
MDTLFHTYLDFAATTPVDPRVLEAMQPYFRKIFGNPSSVHTFGQQAEAALDSARETVAQTLNCRTDEIVFTSCGSESDNLALRGAAFAARRDRGANHILVSPVEHHAVLHTALQLADIYDFDLECIPVDEFGMVSPEDVATRIRPGTAVVSVIYANNEIGTINPIDEIGSVCREHEIIFHTDAVQSPAYLQVDVQALNVDLMTIGAHKFYGPKGVGVLYVRKGTPLVPSLTGGEQEFGLRPGTQNIPYIVGLAHALKLVQAERNQHRARLLALRERIISQTLQEIPGSRLTGHPNQRLPNHVSFVFNGVNGNDLLMMLDVEGFACSSGSACKTGDPKPSTVLTSIGLSPELALGSLRVTLGVNTTSDEIEPFLSILPKMVAQVRQLRGE